MQKFKERKFYIDQSGGDAPGTLEKEVTGWANDLFGIHRSVLSFTLSHISTGLRIVNCPSVDHAKKCAKELFAIQGTNWKNLRPCSHANSERAAELSRQAGLILKKYRGSIPDEEDEE